jgi:hypothetical protein
VAAWVAHSGAHESQIAVGRLRGGRALRKGSSESDRPSSPSNDPPRYPRLATCARMVPRAESRRECLLATIICHGSVLSLSLVLTIGNSSPSEVMSYSQDSFSESRHQVLPAKKSWTLTAVILKGSDTEHPRKGHRHLCPHHLGRPPVELRFAVQGGYSVALRTRRTGYVRRDRARPARSGNNVAAVTFIIESCSNAGSRRDAGRTKR